MTTKKRARALGKKIRSITGLPLPIAMRFGKLIVRGREWDAMENPKLKDHIKHESFPCGAQCCGSRGPVIRGPKGAVDMWGKEI